MKLNWTGIAALIASLAVVLGWAWSIEHRLGQATDVSGRLRAIEEALFPILVDYRVNQIVRERGHEHTYGSLERPDIPLAYVPDGDEVLAPAPEPEPYPEPRPAAAEPPLAEPTEMPAEVQQEAEVWAREQLSL